jgi:hypothetical protein
LLRLINSGRVCPHDIGNKFDHADPAPYPLQVLQRGFAISLAPSPIALADGTRQPDMADMLATRLECRAGDRVRLRVAALQCVSGVKRNALAF